ncbi:hypothetical protein [Phenylobacterium sp.]|uniref:hypothetical protein n=1 Tax=Phenylobacterium sp. TaxID=1871053 RepID=UPI002F9479CA
MRGSPTRQVTQFHAFLEAWLSGAVVRPGALDRTLAAFAPQFRCVDPEGGVQTRADLAGWLLGARGARPGLRIEVTELEEVWRTPTAKLCSYRESQAAPDGRNVRISSALFVREGREPWRWLHVHESWAEG